MVIDVGLSSCARVELLQDSILSFLSNVITRHTLRWIIVEDKVEDTERQEKGRRFIARWSRFFDKIVLSDKRLTYVFCFGEMLKHIESDYFIRWEDDFKFERKFHIDPMLTALQVNGDYAANISFKRNYCNTSDFKQVEFPSSTKHIDENTICTYSWNLIESPLFSIGPGVFNTKLTREIVNLSGTGECHENGVLTPSMNKLGYKSYIWGSKEEPFLLDHIGKNLGFNKGDY